LEDFTRTFSAAFLERESPHEVQTWQRMWERDSIVERAIVAYDGELMVGTSATKPFDLTVPGPAAIPVAGVTAVSVLPTHRRRGILTQMMRHEIESARRRGEIATVLYASEAGIYGRYGYGPATFSASYRVTTGRAFFLPTAPAGGTLRLVDAEEARGRFPEIGNRHARLQPGSMPRSDASWEAWFEGAQHEQDGMSVTFYVLHQGADGADDGFVAYRAGQDRSPGSLSRPSSVVTITRFVTLSDEAYAALWRYVLGLDLVTDVVAPDRPPSEPLRWLLADPRCLRLTDMTDALWLRPLDIPACLAGRRYGAVGALSLQVHDALVSENSGTYILETGPTAARCARSSRRPDLSLGVAHLGSVYLGGASFTELAHAGLVEEHRAGALLEADQMFLSPVVPWCTSEF
jgi:predicted acetyltransferase